MCFILVDSLADGKNGTPDAIGKDVWSPPESYQTDEAFSSVARETGAARTPQ